MVVGLPGNRCCVCLCVCPCNLQQRNKRDSGVGIPIALHPLALFAADGATPCGVRETLVRHMQHVMRIP